MRAGASPAARSLPGTALTAAWPPAARPATTASAWLPPAAPTAAATTTAVVGSRPSFVDVQRTSLERLVVQAGDRGLRCRLGRHFHEAESPRLAAELILQNGCGGDLAEGFEGLPQVGIGHVTGQVPNKDLHRGFLFIRRQRMRHADRDAPTTDRRALPVATSRFPERCRAARAQ